MKKYRLLRQHTITPTITIKEFCNGDVMQRYFTASIYGMKGFKFTSENLKPQQLLDAAVEKCKEIEKLKGFKDNTIEHLKKIYILNNPE